MSDQKVIIVDSIMGSGKTTWLFDHINNHKGECFVYASQYKEEILRFQNSVYNSFSPYEFNLRSKIDWKRIKEDDFDIAFDISTYDNVSATVEGLLNQQLKRVGITHQVIPYLFNIPENVLAKYTLVLDEVFDVLHPYPIKRSELEMLKVCEYVGWDEDGLAFIKDQEAYKAHTGDGSYFSDLLIKISKGQIVVMESDGEAYALIWQLPVALLRKFKEIIVLTWKFKGSALYNYFTKYGFEIVYKSVYKNELVEYGYGEDEIIKSISDRINFVYDYKPLSLSYSKMCGNGEKQKELNKEVYTKVDSIITNKMIGGKDDLLILAFKHNIIDLNRVRGFNHIIRECLIPFNTRSTNKFKDRHNVVFMATKNRNPLLTNFFLMGGSQPSDDDFLLSEVLQGIFRSALRMEDECINLYIVDLTVREQVLRFLGKAK